MIKLSAKIFFLVLPLLFCQSTQAQEQRTPTPQSTPQQVDAGAKPPSLLDAWRQAIPEAEQLPNAALDLAAIAESEASGVGAESKLLTLEDEWLNAVAEKNKATLSRILGADFTYTDARAGAKAVSKNDYIRFATAGQETPYKLDKFSVRLYADTAVMELKFVSKGIGSESPGEAGNGEVLLTTDVWVRRNGVWEAVARHTSRAAAEQTVAPSKIKTAKPE